MKKDRLDKAAKIDDQINKLKRLDMVQNSKSKRAEVKNCDMYEIIKGRMCYSSSLIIEQFNKSQQLRLKKFIVRLVNERLKELEEEFEKV